MSLNPEELQEHCKIILKSNRIDNKIVVLCEGKIPKLGGRRSPESYKDNELIYVLLTLIKAKNFWRKIEPPPDWSRSPEVYRDQLLLEIGKFYSEQSEAEYHLSVFFKILYQFV